MNFEWAMEQLQEGRRVRRSTWTQETIEAGTRIPYSDGDFVVPTTFTRTWHLFMPSDFLRPECRTFWTAGIINGWGGSVGGAGDDPVRDGMLYRPTTEDKAGTDWELLSVRGTD